MQYVGPFKIIKSVLAYAFTRLIEFGIPNV